MISISGDKFEVWLCAAASLNRHKKATLDRVQANKSGNHEHKGGRKLSFVKLSFSSSQTVTVGERMLSFLFFFLSSIYFTDCWLQTIYRAKASC